MQALRKADQFLQRRFPNPLLIHLVAAQAHADRVRYRLLGFPRARRKKFPNIAIYPLKRIDNEHIVRYTNRDVNEQYVRKNNDPPTWGEKERRPS